MSHSTSAPGLRERKKRATRQALQQAAVSLFRANGPESVTVEDICARAEVSPRTFFNYFTAKEEVLVPWDDEIIASTLERIQHRPAQQEPLAVLHTVLREALDAAMAEPTWRDQAILLRDHPELLPRVIASSRELEATVIDGLATRLGRETADPYVRLTGSVGMTALRTAIECHHQSEGSSSPQAFLDRAFVDLHHGLRPDQ